MDQIKAARKSRMLRNSLIRYFAAFVLIAFVLLTLTLFLCGRWTESIQDRYPVFGETYYLTNEQVEQLGSGVVIGTEAIPLSKQDDFLIKLLDVLPIIVAPLCFLGCIIAAVLLFYRNRLKAPFTELREASEKIAENDLDFSIRYQSKDELGQLCTSFERMRSMLAKNFSDLWRQGEERKRLNAAFSHDLRTPLTVLKGQSDLLVKYSSEMSADKISETAGVMKRHIERMEAYVNTMTALQRLEDVEIHKKPTALKDIEHLLRMTAESMCGDKECIINVGTSGEDQAEIDADVVMQVCENLLGNAARFARSQIILSMDVQKNTMVMQVADDGSGFSEQELQHAAEPFYKSGQKINDEHFGMGLYICRILCEKHGGCLKLENNKGAVITAVFCS